MIAQPDAVLAVIVDLYSQVMLLQRELAERDAVIAEQRQHLKAR